MSLCHQHQGTSTKNQFGRKGNHGKNARQRTQYGGITQTDKRISGSQQQALSHPNQHHSINRGTHCRRGMHRIAKALFAEQLAVTRQNLSSQTIAMLINKKQY